MRQGTGKIVIITSNVEKIGKSFYPGIAGKSLESGKSSCVCWPSWLPANEI